MTSDGGEAVVRRLTPGFQGWEPVRAVSPA